MAKPEKIVVLGDQGSGKSSVIERITIGSFNPDFHPTVGMDYLGKDVTYDGRLIRLQLWDLGMSGKRFRGLLPCYIRDSSIAIIVYDVTQPQSFSNVDYWVRDVSDEAGETGTIIIVGTKADLVEERKVSFEDGQKKAHCMQAKFLEVSSKTGEHIATLTLLFASITVALKYRLLVVGSDQNCRAIMGQFHALHQATFQCGGKEAVFTAGACAHCMSSDATIDCREHHSFIQRSSVIVLLFDTSSRHSFSIVCRLARCIREVRKQTVALVLVGNGGVHGERR